MQLNGKALIAFLVLSAILLSGCGATDTSVQATVTVKNSQGQLVEGASVTILKQGTVEGTGTTDATGTLKRSLATGEYTFKATKGNEEGSTTQLITPATNQVTITTKQKTGTPTETRPLAKQGLPEGGVPKVIPPPPGAEPFAIGDVEIYVKDETGKPVEGIQLVINPPGIRPDKIQGNWEIVAGCTSPNAGLLTLTCRGNAQGNVPVQVNPNDVYAKATGKSIPEGTRLHDTVATKTKLCNLAGFGKYESATTDYWRSCRDNYFVRWTTSSGTVTPELVKAEGDGKFTTRLLIGIKYTFTVTKGDATGTEEKTIESGKNIVNITITKTGGEVCAQVITYATAPDGTCKSYPTPCDVPTGHTKVDKCPAAPPVQPPTATKGTTFTFDKDFSSTDVKLKATAFGNTDIVSATGRASGAVEFLQKGSKHDYLVISDPESKGDLNYTVDYTVAMWVKPESTANQSIFAKTNELGPVQRLSEQLRIFNGVFEHYTYDGVSKVVRGATKIKDGEYYHVAITAKNNGKARLYVNGKEEGTAQDIATLWNEGDRYYVASNSAYNAGYFKGYIDELAIYKEELSAQEIAGLYGPRTAPQANTPGEVTVVPARPGTTIKVVGSPIQSKALNEGANLKNSFTGITDIAESVIVDQIEEDTAKFRTGTERKSYKAGDTFAVKRTGRGIYAVTVFSIAVRSSGERTVVVQLSEGTET